MTSHATTMTVECRTCPVRELQCGDCMVPVLLDLTAPALHVDHALDPEERAVVTRLVQAGLVDAETASRARARIEPVEARSDATRGSGRAVG